ncbi:MAG: hypothetical protein NVS4B10_02960 [Myxococcales bacterium]
MRGEPQSKKTVSFFSSSATGAPVELVFLDEAGGTTKQVSEYRDLVQRQNVDLVIGYISSGDCLAVAPVALFESVPLVRYAAAALLGLWGLHWVVVDALDDARVLLPGETVASAEAAAERSAPPPWFVRGFYRAAEALQRAPAVPAFVAWLVRKFARACDRLAVPWREEIALLESHRALGLGFGLTTAALLATPVLNLLFRPIIIVAAVHLLGHLEPGEAGHGHPGAPAAPPLPQRR